MTYQDPRTAVLGTINRVRDRLGVPALADLPRGVMCDPDECTVQRALRFLSDEVHVQKKYMVVPNELVPALRDVFGSVRVKYYSSRPGYARMGMPNSFKEFIELFDAGEYGDIAVPYGTELPFEEPSDEAPDFFPAEWADELEPAGV